MDLGGCSIDTRPLESEAVSSIPGMVASTVWSKNRGHIARRDLPHCDNHISMAIDTGGADDDWTSRHFV